MKILLLISLFGLLGCQNLKNIVHYKSADDLRIERENEARLAELRARPKLSEVEKCEKGLECDLIVYTSLDEVNSMTAACIKIKDKAKKTKCLDEIGGMVVARWALKYPQADFAKANLQCKANPVNCDTSTIKGRVALETYIRDSHQLKLDEEAYAQEEAAAEQRQIAEAQRKQRIGAAFKAFGDSMQRSAQQNTSCESVPNGLGGFRTTCH